MKEPTKTAYVRMPAALNEKIWGSLKGSQVSFNTFMCWAAEAYLDTFRAEAIKKLRAQLKALEGEK